MYEAFLSNVAEPIDFFQVSLSKYTTPYISTLLHLHFLRKTLITQYSYENFGAVGRCRNFCPKLFVFSWKECELEAPRKRRK